MPLPSVSNEPLHMHLRGLLDEHGDVDTADGDVLEYVHCTMVSSLHSS